MTLEITPNGTKEQGKESCWYTWLSCVNTWLSCVNTWLSCVNTWLSCVNTWLYCVNTWLYCVNTWLSCVNTWLSCVNTWLYCVNTWLYCVNTWLSCVIIKGHSTVAFSTTHNSAVIINNKMESKPETKWLMSSYDLCFDCNLWSFLGISASICQVYIHHV